MDPKETKQNKIHNDQCYKQHVKKEAQHIEDYRRLPYPDQILSLDQYKHSIEESKKKQIKKNEKRIRNNNGHTKQRHFSANEIVQDEDIALK